MAKRVPIDTVDVIRRCCSAAQTAENPGTRVEYLRVGRTLFNRLANELKEVAVTLEAQERAMGGAKTEGP
jgi:hypothetical protein